jgi:hypothetical protein
LFNLLRDDESSTTGVPIREMFYDSLSSVSLDAILEELLDSLKIRILCSLK